MKKIIMILCILSFNAIANNVKDIEFPSKQPFPFDEIPDSGIETITIPAHSRTPEVNKKHAEFCKEMGGIDVSDDEPMRVSKGSPDAGVCLIQDEKKAKEFDKKHGIKFGNGAVGTINYKDAESGGAWEAHAPTDNVGFVNSSDV